MHQNSPQRSPAAVASVRSAAPANLQAPPDRLEAPSRASSAGKQPDQTSTPATRSNARMPHRPHYTAVCRFAPCRRPDEHGPSDQTRDAKGREPLGARSHGRSVVAFYNEVRPHSALRGRTPASITLPSCSPASRPLRAGFAGGLRPGLTQAARDGADEGGRDGETPLDRTKKHRHDGRDGNPGLYF